MHINDREIDAEADYSKFSTMQCQIGHLLNDPDDSREPTKDVAAHTSHRQFELDQVRKEHLNVAQ
jgi:hypothetical protein